jgi:hypothetical protein
LLCVLGYADCVSSVSVVVVWCVIMRGGKFPQDDPTIVHTVLLS